MADWEGMKDNVKTWISNCIQCAMNKTQPPNQAFLMCQRLLGLWHQLQIDFIDKLPRSKEGFQYVLVNNDSFSGWIEAFPTKNNSVGTAANKLFNEVVCRFSTPEIIDSENRGSFVGETFTMML